MQYKVSMAVVSAHSSVNIEIDSILELAWRELLRGSCKLPESDCRLIGE